MANTIAIIVVIILFILTVFVIPTLLFVRNVPKVIRIFRFQNAVGTRNARTVDELGLRPKPMLQRLFSGRDYKPQALQSLIRANIVQATDEGKLYLSEEDLANSRWRGH
ncbi:hypothetical protein ACFLXG_03730 [Chloroflexota bacterium]